MSRTFAINEQKSQQNKKHLLKTAVFNMQVPFLTTLHNSIFTANLPDYRETFISFINKENLSYTT